MQISKSLIAGMVIAGSGAFFLWPSFSLLTEIYDYYEAYAHGYIVPIISLTALFGIRKQLVSNIVPSPKTGCFILACGMICLMLIHWYTIALLPFASLGGGCLTAISIILCLSGVVLITGGLPMARTAGFPLLFLFFAVPWPAQMTEPFTLKMRTFAAIMAEITLRWFDILVNRQGNILNLNTICLGVAEACSGIKSVWVMMAAGAALAYFLRCGFFRGMTICLSGIPVSIIANSVRVVLTTFLVVRIGPEYAHGIRHEIVGMITFAGGMITLAGLSMLLSKNRRVMPEELVEQKDTHDHTLKMANVSNVSTVFIISLTFLFISSGIIQNIVTLHYSPISENMLGRKPFSDFPHETDSFKETARAEFGEEEIKILRPKDHILQTCVTSTGDRIRYWAVYWGSDRKSVIDAHLPDNCFPSQGWTRVRTHDFDGKTDGILKDTVHIRLFKRAGLERVVLYFYNGGRQVKPKIEITARIKQLIESWNDNRPVIGPQYIVTMETDVLSTVQDAKDAVQRFAVELCRILPAYGIYGMEKTEGTSKK
ncbi:exosortase/archaeosortase family protein [Desulfobacterales bacterium HSG16]|nr:exosortase/archaeosortase family protein [Desulfobacterales bacterium HSG16]